MRMTKTQSKTYSRTHANRGMVLENLINMTNNQYRNTGFADIDKVPTDVKILKVTGNRISGFLRQGKWVDYTGVFKGRSILFDAKETKEKRFPLKNLSKDQYMKLREHHIHGGASFLIISFTTLHEEIYLLRFEQLEAAWNAKEAGGLKSIPLQFFQDHCIEVKSSDGYVLHYLKALMLGGGE